jgi:hypothetical protein
MIAWFIASKVFKVMIHCFNWTAWIGYGIQPLSSVYYITECVSKLTIQTESHRVEKEYPIDDHPFQVFWDDHYNMVATTINTVIKCIVSTLTLLIGVPRKRGSPQSLQIGKSRFHSLRKVPWRSRAMFKLALLTVASNTQGRIASKQRPTPHRKERFPAFTSLDKVDCSDRYLQFDTDSFDIKVDNCCTYSLTPDLADFIGPIPKVKGKYIRSFSGKDTPVLHKGTIKWTVNNDVSIARDIIIPNAYHVPAAPVRLLSPQHWAQQARDNKPNPKGTWCATYDTDIVLQWNQRSFTKTIPLDPTRGNVGTMWSNPGYGQSRSYLQEDDEIPLCYEVEGVVPGNESDDEFADEPEEPDDMHEPADPTPTVSELRKDPIKTDFNLDGPNVTNPALIEPDDLKLDPSALMLRWHHKLSHVSMERIKLMAQNGQLPKPLATCGVPLCQACKYGKAT